jgi:hypothetical protein
VKRKRQINAQGNCVEPGDADVSAGCDDGETVARGAEEGGIRFDTEKGPPTMVEVR